MAGRERSKGACWTCKLRKKKCDERRPSCSICTYLCIDCHGYGTKPTWMDGSAAERQMVDVIRHTVKETTLRKRKIKTGQRQSSVSAAKPKRGYRSSPPITAPPLQTPPVSLSDSPSSRSASLAETLRTSDDHSIRLEENEARLLMHYLDNVFQLQFPFYRPTAAEGGRGWLLAILTKIKPLYHVALSIAAYQEHYDRYFGATCNDDLPNCPLLNDLEQQYLLALEGLRHYLEVLGTATSKMPVTDVVEIISCVALLTSLEVFKGSGDQWQIHLHGAQVMLPFLAIQCPMASDVEISATHTLALPFFAGITAWYDILSCATTGSNPFSVHSCLANSMGYIHLDKLMGCENWVMLSIMEIGVLSYWKRQMQREEQLSVCELVGRAQIIERKLEDGVANVLESLDSLRTQGEHPTDSGHPAYGSRYLTLLISRIFVYAALVYLHVTVSGSFPEIPEIRHSISRIIPAFRALPPGNLIRHLTWPLCIAGCMASGEQQKIFRSLATTNNLEKYPFGSSPYALEILETCWRLRQSGESSGVDWTTAMEILGINILLV